jgi:hypothetical protein
MPLPVSLTSVSKRGKSAIFPIDLGNFLTRRDNPALAVLLYFAALGALCAAVILRLRYFWTLVSSVAGSLVFAAAFLVPFACFGLALIGSWQSLRRVKQRGVLQANMAELTQALVAVTAIPMLLWSTYDGWKSVRAISHAVDLLKPPGWHIREDGSALYVTGKIGEGLGDAVKESLSRNRAIRIVVLDSPGGKVGEAMRIAELVKLRHVSTGVNNRCASACTFIFAAGRERILLPPARLGFHGCSDYLSYFRCDNSEEEKSLVMDGVDPQFAHKAIAVDPAKIWFPTPAELLSAHVITGPTIEGHR